jgi:predicted membrane-bound mannosyltransferase
VLSTIMLGRTGGAVSVGALLAFSFERTATRAATLIIQYGAYLILAAYLMTVIAALAWTWRTRRRPLPVAILTAAAVVLGVRAVSHVRTIPRRPVQLGRPGRCRPHGRQSRHPAQPRHAAAAAPVSAARGHHRGCPCAWKGMATRMPKSAWPRIDVGAIRVSCPEAARAMPARWFR